MPEANDNALLAEYARTGSEPAFATLVQRHIALVHSVALRHVGNPSQADEITQAVFIILARKAKALGRKTILSGWLYQTARLTAANFFRAELRRQRREQEAYMESFLNEPTPEIWTQIAPLLDDAMGRLGKPDRNVIVLRFFENKSAREIANALAIDPGTAQKRVTRAVERLRKIFLKRGVTHPASLLTQTISTNAVQAAPVALAKTVTAVAIAKGAVAGSSTLTLVKGALKIMAWTKAKTAAVVGVAVLLSAGTYTTVEVAHWRTAEQGKVILSKVIAANRFWLLAPPDSVTDYSYVFHLAWSKTPSPYNETPVHVADPRNAPANERQGITYSSALQYLAKHPELVRVQSIEHENGKIRLALKFLYAPGARTFYVMRGKKRALAPLRIFCGNGIKNAWKPDFSTGGTYSELVIDSHRMVPLSSLVKSGWPVEETFSNYAEVSPGNYVPLSISVKAEGAGFRPDRDMVVDWTFKLHHGLWLFDQGQYQGRKVAWTDQVVVH